MNTLEPRLSSCPQVSCLARMEYSKAINTGVCHCRHFSWIIGGFLDYTQKGFFIFLALVIHHGGAGFCEYEIVMYLASGRCF